MAYDRIDPIGDVRGDILMAQLCQLVAAVAGDKDAKLDTYLPKWDAKAESPGPKLMKTSADQMKLMFQLAGVKVIDKRPGHGGSR